MTTNAMRLLNAANIPFELLAYEANEADLSGVRAAASLSVPPEQLFKTLVLMGDRTGPFVCVIPCGEEIDLRKAAKAAGDKGCEMLPMNDLLSLTGYIRGGCSPIGMKKKLPTFIDESCQLFDWILVSAGARGHMVRIDPRRLIEYTGAAMRDLTALEVLR